MPFSERLPRYTARWLSSARLRSLAAVALPINAVSLVFPETAWSMVDTWLRSGTFAHGFVVVPIVLFLAWRQGEFLAQEPVQPSAAAAIALTALGFAWLFGQAANIVSLAQFAVVALVPALVFTLFGSAWLKRLAFPCAFLFFCVPFGEALVPTMIDWTADFLVTSLRLSGVPVYREGNVLAIPNGTWSVVDACSGVRYLIASLMTGVLFAHLTYRSPLRIGGFVALSIAVPIVANWVRAYGIVMLGYLSGNRIATGVDHLIYGWLFFAFVIFVLFAIGFRWREPFLADVKCLGAAPAGGTVPLPRSIAARSRSVAAAAALAVIAVLPWRLTADAIAPASDTRPLTIAPLPAIAGWDAVPTPPEDWAPRLQGERAVLRQSFVRNDGQRVGIVVALFRDQRQGAELVGSGNAVAPAERWDWKALAKGRSAGVGRYAAANFVELAGPQRRLLVWHWYWLGATVTTSEVRAKLDLAAARLRGRSDASAWVLVYTEVHANGAEAQATLASFISAMSGAIDTALSEAAR